VDYSLTPLGAATAERLFQLIEFVEDHMLEVTASQAAYDART
jgi:DNA-binding HxlR family transcriptional regulator